MNTKELEIAALTQPVNKVYGMIFDGRLLPAYITEFVEVIDGDTLYTAILDKHYIQIPVLHSELKESAFPGEYSLEVHLKLKKSAKKIRDAKGKEQFQEGESVCITKGIFAGYRCKVIRETEKGMTVIEMYNRDNKLLRTAEVRKDILIRLENEAKAE